MLVIIFLDAISHVAHSDAFSAFTYFMAAMMQIGAVVLLVLSAGGMSPKDFKKEIGDVIEVVRRGESEKEVIIPLRGSQRPADAGGGEAPQKVYKIDDPKAPRRKNRRLLPRPIHRGRSLCHEPDIWRGGRMAFTMGPAAEMSRSWRCALISPAALEE